MTHPGSRIIVAQAVIIVGQAVLLGRPSDK
jgi:hypothetical protein